MEAKALTGFVDMPEIPEFDVVLGRIVGGCFGEMVIGHKPCFFPSFIAPQIGCILSANIKGFPAAHNASASHLTFQFKER
jgi:hypothetical protein